MNEAHVENSTEVFLKEFHRAKPSCSPKLFGLAKSSDSQSSYDRIIGEVAIDFSGRMLDLACGDGFLLEKFVRRGLLPSQLFGIDMSDGELDVAKSRTSLKGVDLKIGNAHEAKASIGALGDQSMRSALSIRESFANLFAPHILELTDFSIEFQGKPDVLAASLMELYDGFVLSHEAQIELERRLFQEFKTKQDQNESFDYRMGLRKIVVNKA